MSANILLQGSLAKAPESRVSRQGNAFAMATLRVASGNESQFWRLFVFSESAQAELMRLGEGDALACQGSPKFELFRPEAGEPACPCRSRSTMFSRCASPRASERKRTRKPTRPRPRALKNPRPIVRAWTAIAAMVPTRSTTKFHFDESGGRSWRTPSKHSTNRRTSGLILTSAGRKQPPPLWHHVMACYFRPGENERFRRATISLERFFAQPRACCSLAQLVSEKRSSPWRGARQFRPERTSLIGKAAAARVIYLDGELPAETFKERMELIGDRFGNDIEFWGFSRDALNSDEMPPLNTPAGRAWLWREIETIKPDLIVFDAIMSLLGGNMSEEEFMGSGQRACAANLFASRRPNMAAPYRPRRLERLRD